MVDVSPTLSPGAKYFPSYLQCMLKISSRLPEMEGVPLTKARNMVVEALEEVEEVCTAAKFRRKMVTGCVCEGIIFHRQMMFVW